MLREPCVKNNLDEYYRCKLAGVLRLVVAYQQIGPIVGRRILAAVYRKVVQR